MWGDKNNISIKIQVSRFKYQNQVLIIILYWGVFMNFMSFDSIT